MCARSKWSPELTNDPTIGVMNAFLSEAGATEIGAFMRERIVDTGGRNTLAPPLAANK